MDYLWIVQYFRFSLVMLYTGNPYNKGHWRWHNFMSLRGQSLFRGSFTFTVCNWGQIISSLYRGKLFFSIIRDKLLVRYTEGKLFRCVTIRGLRTLIDDFTTSYKRLRLLKTTNHLSDSPLRSSCSCSQRYCITVAIFRQSVISLSQ